MSLSNIKIIILIISVFIVSLLTINYLTPDYHPDGGLKLKLSKDEISEIGNKIVKSYRPELKDEKRNLSLESNPAILRWLRSTNRIDSANRKIREQNLSYFWLLKVLSVNDTNLLITSDKNQNIETSTVLELKISQEGKLIAISEVFNETKITNYFSEDSAKSFLERQISSLADYISFTNDSQKINFGSYLFTLDKIELIQKLNRKDYNFVWKGYDDSGQLIYLKASIIGDKLKSFELILPVPDEYSNSDPDIYEIVTTIFLLLFVLIMVIVIGLKRIKAYEIGYKNAIIFAFIYTFFFALAQILELSFDFHWNIMLGIIIAGIFIFLSAVALWAVGETYLREIWNEKFSSFDLIRHKYLNHSIIGRTLSVSVAAGLFLTAIYLILIKFESNYFYLNFTSKNFQTVKHINSDYPLFYLFSSSISSNLLLIIPLLFFISGSVVRYFNERIGFISVNSILFALLIYLFIEPIYASLIVSFAIGIILSILFYEFDLLTTSISFILFNFFLRAADFSFIGNESFTHYWTLTILLSAISIIIGFVFILTKDKSVDVNSLAPKFLENITERQRMKKELEVARIVQMSFLPKKDPVLNGVQIASVCIPAFEVGGDYYDFIKLSENKIGIIIGDVSGKGTQAAFYMTLAKGFIKAIAKESDSPADILSKMNELFYENVERGRFISMIYAILDLEKRVIKIARAGHNPVLINHNSGKINLITPKGLALGLEKGIIFRQVISEEIIQLEKGNTFVFYTDGFTEAINSKGEEFGLDRIQKILEQYSYESAEKIREILLAEVKKFIGKTHQYDDMTMVIVKVNS
ncbi:PP2C family protein-serine/threonine phosphatase [Ignavibacterium sp.]|uniref:PP2C family protein-serine/threonine phosphatase n=1 Tax=Ignavibacterium sp. TaxID=2651167 RepID=UPI0021FF7A20|nr:PP2C family protein-serine/threonine phosphatase [Ignavibacterium sp.]BDQ02207.1 MAG: hypothetical protein KatS3mg037_0782 [Ignavibacterium sp.]